MGTFRYPIELGNVQQSQFTRLEAWVDSGATYTWVPRPTLARLGFAPVYRRRFRIANGQVIERDICWAPIRIGQEVLPCLVVFGDEDSEPLLGAMTLEAFSLGVDGVNRTLVPVLSNLFSVREVPLLHGLR